MSKLSGRVPGSRESFDPARVRALLEAVAPICAVIADYVTHPGPVHEPSDRILGRIGRSGELPPYLTWAQLCRVEDAAYDLVRHSDNADAVISVIAGEAQRAET